MHYQIKIKRQKRVTYYSIIVTLLLALILPLLFAPFFSRYNYFPLGSQSNSYFANYDYEIATWLSNNTPKNAIILSDYFGMKIYQGLSDRPNLFSGLNSGEESSVAQDVLWFLKQNILFASSSEVAYSSISSFVSTLNSSAWIAWQERNNLSNLRISLVNPDVFIVITPRTCAWLEQRGISDVRAPYYNVNNTYLLQFNNSDYFKLAYSVENEFYIFTPRKFSLWTAGSYSCMVGQNVDDSELANWSNKSITGNSLVDNSQYGHDGEIYGALFVQGKYGKTLNFDGVDDYVSVPTSSSLTLNNPLTIEAWICPSSLGNNEIIGVANQFMLRIDPTYDLNTVSFFVVINGVYEPRARGTVLPIDEWSYVVGVYDGIQVKIYVNGQLVGRSYRNGELANASDTLKIGNISGHFFNGSMGDIHIYNRALGAEEIAEHYKGNYLRPSVKAETSKMSPGYIVDIPFKVNHFFKGEIKIESKVNLNNSSQTAFRCEIYDAANSSLVFSKNIMSVDYNAANVYENLYLGKTNVLNPLHDYRLRIYFADDVNVWVGTIRLLE